MANKKPNEVSGWKNKLAALDSLPDETLLDRNEQWQQLHSRLQQKKDRKKWLWYWAAAGILLLFTSLLWTINTKQSGELPAVVSVEQLNKKALQPSVSTKVSDTMYTVTDLSAKTDTKPAQVAAPTQTDTVVSPIRMPQPIVIAETVAIAKTLPNILPADTQLVAAVATPLPAKQKLKVVHINELNYPATTAPRIYTGQDYSVQQNRFINQPVYSTVTPSTSSIQFTISSSKKILTN